MASVPDTKVFTAPTIPGMPLVAEGEGAEVFASLLPTLVAPGVPAPEGTVPGAMPVPELPVADVRPAGKAATGKVVDDFDPRTPDGDTGDADTDASDDTDPLATLIAQANFVPAVQVPQPAAKPAPAPTAKGPAVTLPAPALPLPLPVQAGAPAPAPAAPPPAAEEAVRLAAASVSGTAETATSTAPKTPSKKVAQTRADARQADMPVRAATASAVPTVETPAPAKPAPAARESAAPVAATMPPVATPVGTTTMPFAPVDPAAPSIAAARTEAPQPAPAADQAVTRELDLAHDSEWLDGLARDIARTQDGDTPLRFKLHPQTLGHLKVEVSQTDQGATVRLTVETEAARAILADAQPRLAAEARAQGVRLAHTEVDLGNSGQQASGDPRRQEDGRQPAFIRTARGARAEAIAPAETARARSDRYA